MRTRRQAADPSVVDLPFLSSTYDVAETEIQSLLDAPTTELVKEFLASLTNKAHDFDALKADKVKVDVELENTVRTSDSKAKAQKAQLTKHVKEIEDLRTKLNTADAARESLASELDTLRSSTSGSTADLQTLRQRIETLEASNRDALALVESKSTEKDRVATELSEQHGKLLDLRREINALEEKNQSLENAASSQKFKEQSLQQEIELLKRNNEWHSNELKTRGEEHAKFRKERNARIAALQREVEDSSAALETLKRTETTLRQRLEEVQGKADEALARIAALQEEAVRKEQDFRAELDATKRLADLQAQNAATHKARLQDVQGQIDQLKEEAADEIGRLQAEIETERGDKEQAERRVAELELEVERLEAMPRTPMRNGRSRTPASRAGSPSAMPGSLRKTVNGLSFTELYSQFTQAQQDLQHERGRTQKLSQAVEDMLEEMEKRAPEMAEAQEDRARMEEEIITISNLLDEANANREGSSKEVQKWRAEAQASEKEADVLRQQLRDLSAQVKILLVEIQSRDQGLEEMTNQERLDLERAARGEMSDEDLARMTDTGRFIAERLVIFRDVADLQDKNVRMLRLVQDLGDQLEGVDAQEKERQSAAYASENEELRAKCQRLQDELEGTVKTIDSYVKERDMFRRMLQHRGQIPPTEEGQMTLFGQSMGPPATPSRNNGPVQEPQTPRSQDVQDLNKLLKEQQAFFDTFRNESATDRRTLKEQVDALAREKSNLQADVSRLQSQLELAGGRYEMLQSNLTATRSENAELAKRSQSMAEQAARQDLRTQQVAEDLVEARAMTESLRNEGANAKAERELWKRVEGRLVEDQRNLIEERSRLNKLVADLQNLQNERELAESEARRRMQGRTEGVEAELAETKRKLESEVEESRKAALRREYEEGQSRTRIDDLVKSLGNVREELVAAKTQRDTLQARVEEMKIDLRAAEEKTAALLPRPTPRAETQQNGTAADGEELEEDQRLAIEVSDLKRELELARNELEAARQQVEQYRSIAQSTEEELARFTETNEQYKEDTDRVFAEKDARIKELEQRVEDLTTELTTTSTGMSELRAQADEATRALEEHRTTSTSELARLRDDAERYAEEKRMLQGDIRAQAEIAQQAQQSYEDELVKHAAAAQSLQAVRKEYNELRTEVAGIRAEAEAAKASLETSEESWGEQRERFEREVEEGKRRRGDLEGQNRVLHQQMESFSAELAALRSGRAAAASPGGEESAGSPSRAGGDSNLQEVVRFLRREKEIVDVQYELSMQEAKRLQQQLEYANSALETVRQTLADERRKAAERTREEGSVERLQQTINELNLHRESATTLRNEARVAREKLEEKSREIERLVAEAEPLHARIGELEGEVEAKQGEVELLQRDRDHWRERTQNIISKYDRVDPAELESMKAQLEELKAEKERLEAEQAPLKEQIAGHAAKLEEDKQSWMTKLENFKNQAKERNRQQTEAKGQLAAQRDQANNGLAAVRTELEKTKERLVEVEGRLAEREKSAGVDEGEVREGEDEHAALHQRVAEAEARAGEHAGSAEELRGTVATVRARVEELEGQVTGLQEQLNTAQQPQAPSTDTETLGKVRQELATAQQEIEALRADAGADKSAAAPATNTATADNQEQTEAQRRQAAVDQLRSEMQAQHQLALTQKDEENARKMETLKSNLRRQLGDGRERQREEARQELVAQHTAEVQKLKEEHEAALQQMRDAHAAELERLTKDGDKAVEKAEGAGGVVKPEEGADMATLEVTDAQITQLLKTNERCKRILSNNISQKVAAQTKALKESVEQKDEEIAKLKGELATAQAAQAPAATAAAGDVKEIGGDQVAELQGKLDETVKAREELQGKLDEAVKAKEDLQTQLDDAVKSKETAVRNAIDVQEKKVKVQLSMRDKAMAQITAVKKAVTDTPERGVKEVWDVAVKAMPPPKIQPPAIATGPGAGVVASPGGAQKPAPTPTQAPAPVHVPQSAVAQQTPEQIEAAKLKARQERFGPVASDNTATAAPAFGRPSSRPSSSAGQGTSSALNKANPFASGTGSFAQLAPTGGHGTNPNPFGQSNASGVGSGFSQLSQPNGSLAQPARHPSGPNPQASAFTPGNAGTGPAALRGLSSGIPRGGVSALPRPGGAAGRGRGGGDAGVSFQGAATRGGLQSGLPRGPGNNNNNRGGRGGGSPRGGKRPFDGDGAAGDGKRPRGGGPGGADG